MSKIKRFKDSLGKFMFNRALIKVKGKYIFWGMKCIHNF